MEDEEWNWDDTKEMEVVSKNPKLQVPTLEKNDESLEDWENEMVDDVSVRSSRLLSDVYQRCNIAVCEPSGFEEAKLDNNWMVAMKEELHMIEKNNT